MNIHAIFKRINELEIGEEDRNILKVIMNLAVRDYVRAVAKGTQLSDELVLQVYSASLEQTSTLSNLGIMVLSGIDVNGREIKTIRVPVELLNAWEKTSFVEKSQQK